MNPFKTLTVAATVALLTTAGVAHAGATLDAIKKNGVIKCGISDGLPGFSYADEKGNYSGIDVDVCRAVAAALFGDATKVKFTPLTAKERFTALQSGEIDVLSRNTTWTSSRDSAQGLNFVGVTYYDGQGFLVNKKLGVKSAKKLDGATVCVQAGTTTELNLSDYFRANKMKLTPISYDKSDESAKSLEAGRCDVLTSDQSQLYAQRIKLAKPDDYIVLPEVISKEPLGPLVRHGDDDWFDIVKWSLFVMVNAEELGITSKNIEEMKKSTNPDVKRLLGVKSAKKLDGATVCVQAGTTTELNLSDYFRANKMKLTPISYDKSDESAKSLEAGRCDVLTSDQSQLYAQRIKLAKPDDYIVLPEVISKEPLGPLVRHGDDDWFDIVKWSLFVMVNAEELGITSKNIEEMKKSTNPDVKRLLGVEGDKGKDFGLPNEWMATVIKQVGNYGEIFERNVGKGSALKIERGLNALWNQGGLQYAPPIR